MKTKTYYQISKIGNKYYWTGTAKVPQNHHIDSDENYIWTTSEEERDRLNKKEIKSRNFIINLQK